MSGAQADIKIGFDTGDMSKELAKLNRTIEDQISNMAAKFQIFDQVAGYVMKLAGAVLEYSKAAAEVEAIERRAQAAIVQTGRFTQQQFEQLRMLNEEREKQLAIDADDQLKLQARLAALGVLPSRLNEATEATIGLAEVTGKDLAEAGTIVAKVFQGQFTALSRLGVQVNSAGEAMEYLAGTYTLAGEQADSTATKQRGLGIAVDNLGEAVGKFINKQGLLNTAMSYGVRILDWYTKGFEEAAKLGSFGAIFDFATSGVAVEALPAPGEGGGSFDFLSDSLNSAGRAEAAVSPMLAKPRAAGKKSKGPGRRRQESEGMGSVVGTAGADLSGIDPDSWEAIQALFGGDPGISINKEGLDKVQAEHARFFEDYRSMLDRETETTRQQEEVFGEVLGAGMQIAGNGLAQMFSDLFTGAKDAGEAVLALVGNIITGIGQMLIQLGTAAVLAGALGTAVPIFAGITGGPAGVALGAAMIVGGAAMVGVGAVLGGSAKGGGSSGASSPPTSSRGDRGRSTTRFSGFSGAGSELSPNMFAAGAGQTVVNYNFNQPVADERAAARRFNDLLRRDEPLRGGGW